MKANTVSTKRRPSLTVRHMVVTAMLAAVTALLTFTPVGMIQLPPPLPAVTLVHLPVILAALIEGPWVGVPVGLVFGLCSLIRAWGSGMVGLTLFFRNPLVSVLPRMMIPLMAWGAYTLWNRLFKRKGAADKIGAGVAAVVGALTNTVLCLGMIVLLYGNDLTVIVNNLISGGSADTAYLNNAGAWLVVAVGLPNGLAEAAVAAVVVPMVKVAVDAVNRRGKRGGKPGTAAKVETETASDAEIDLGNGASTATAPETVAKP
ncbi:MAG: ECF transporter S component [Eubacteriales bacterium]|nr:ECF transporter S component [Eubacteriales bacterium]